MVRTSASPVPRTADGHLAHRWPISKVVEAPTGDFHPALVHALGALCSSWKREALIEAIGGCRSDSEIAERARIYVSSISFPTAPVPVHFGMPCSGCSADGLPLL
jgi:hypothetical protein